ncbi:hypothetical protein Tco_1502627 [Tanacetum coccineum]
MDIFTKGALWDYWKMGGDEIKLNDDESSDFKEYRSDKEEETAEIFKIKTDIFDYETPLCLAFNEFNYLLKEHVCSTQLIQGGSEQSHMFILSLQINDSDYQYAISIKEDTAYSCQHSPKTTKETSPICRSGEWFSKAAFGNEIRSTFEKILQQQRVVLVVEYFVLGLPFDVIKFWIKALNLQFSSVSTEASGFESMFSIPSSSINILKDGLSKRLMKISAS